jgi:hypothetical protein
MSLTYITRTSPEATQDTSDSFVSALSLQELAAELHLSPQTIYDLRRQVVRPGSAWVGTCASGARRSRRGWRGLRTRTRSGIQEISDDHGAAAHPDRQLRIDRRQASRQGALSSHRSVSRPRRTAARGQGDREVGDRGVGAPQDTPRDRSGYRGGGILLLSPFGDLVPPSISARRTHVRSVSVDPIPSCAAIVRIASNSLE